MPPAASDFDKAARYAARYLDPAGLLRWLLGEGFWAAWRWTGWLQTEAIPFPGEPARRADSVASFERRAADAGPVAVVVEFMSQPRPEIFKRLAEYAFLVSRSQPYQEDPRVEYDVLGVVVNLTGSQPTGVWEVRPPDCGGLGFTGSVEVVNLTGKRAKAVLAGVAAEEVSRGLLAWLPLMDGGGDPDAIPEWRRLAEQEPHERKRADLGGLALVFANLAGCLDVWQRGLEGWNMERSLVVQQWQADAEARGYAEGEARGRVETARAKLLRTLEVRLKEVPEQIVAAVRGLTDPAALDRWFDAALRADTLEQFRQAVGLPANGSP